MGGGGRHLVVDVGERDSRLLESAAVITRREDDLSGVFGETWAREVLRAFPGCRMAAILNPSSRAATVYSRHSPSLRVQPHRDPMDDGLGSLDPAVLASVVYALDLSRNLPAADALVLSLDIGESNLRVEVVP